MSCIKCSIWNKSTKNCCASFKSLKVQMYSRVQYCDCFINVCVYLVKTVWWQLRNSCILYSTWQFHLHWKTKCIYLVIDFLFYRTVSSLLAAPGLALRSFTSIVSLTHKHTLVYWVSVNWWSQGWFFINKSFFSHRWNFWNVIGTLRCFSVLTEILTCFCVWETNCLWGLWMTFRTRFTHSCWI